MVRELKFKILYALVVCYCAYGCSILDPYGNEGWKYIKSNALDSSSFALSSPYKLRIPFCEMSNSGTMLIGCDVRENTVRDLTKISIGIIRYNRSDASFSDAQIIIPHTDMSSSDRAMDGTILVDRTTGRIFVFAHRITTNLYWEETHSTGEHGFSCVFVYSDDDGITWSDPQNLGDFLECDYSDVVTLFGGVGHGITMEDGTLVLPIQCKMATSEDSSAFNIQSGILYSKDHGETWKSSKSLVPCYSSENMVVEYKEGSLMINCKSYVGLRRVFVTSNMGDSWEKHSSDMTLIEPTACQGSFHRVGNMCYFLNPMNDYDRYNITLQISDDFSSWKPVLLLQNGWSYGYSCLCNWKDELYAVTETNGESIMLYRIFKKDQ